MNFEIGDLVLCKPYYKNSGNGELNIVALITDIVDKKDLKQFPKLNFYTSHLRDCDKFVKVELMQVKNASTTFYYSISRDLKESKKIVMEDVERMPFIAPDHIVKVY